MITPKPLASAMMVPTRQVTLPTSAGRSVRFAQGVATINDTNDLPYLLARADVKMTITPYAMSWMGEVFEKTPKINADVHWPADWEVYHVNQGDWLLKPLEQDPPAEPDDDDQPEAPDPTPEPEPVPVALDKALKGKSGWLKPPAS